MATSKGKNAAKGRGTRKSAKQDGQPASKPETVADAPAAVRKANQEGLIGFDGSRIVNAMSEAFAAAQSAKQQQEAKAQAALILVLHAHEIRTTGDNAAMTAEDWAAGWRYEMKALLPRLHGAGIGWVDTRTAKEDGRTLYSLTGYGQNVSSTANQVGQYAEAIDVSAIESYRDAVKAVAAAKEAERLAKLTDAEKELEAALALFDEGLAVYAKLIHDGALGVVERANEDILALIKRECIESEKPVPVIGQSEPEGEETKDGEPEGETPELEPVTEGEEAPDAATGTDG